MELTARFGGGTQAGNDRTVAFVRHPIYTGMLGMLVDPGLAVSHWAALLAALVVFCVGTTIRVRSERGTARAFGEQFEKKRGACARDLARFVLK